MDDSVTKTFGRLYLGKIKEIGLLPVSEIDELKQFDDLPKCLTYSEIQPKLIERTLAIIKNCEDIHLK